jgi:hypothetical protein
MIRLTYIISPDTFVLCAPPCTKHHRFAHFSSLGAQYPIHSSEAVNISLSTTYTFMYVDFSSCCRVNDKYDDEIKIWFIVFSVCLQLVSTLRLGSVSLSLSCSTWVSLTQLILFSQMLKEFFENMYISFVQMK